jgi:eukaryotic-like serine/threonine-protein kinase
VFDDTAPSARDPVSRRSDIYALRTVAYEMLAGEAPFTGPSVPAIVARLISEEPRSLTAQHNAAVLRALEKLPADRFSTAAEFVAAAMGGSPPATPAPGIAVSAVWTCGAVSG